jgi:hypothetical protein
MKKLYTSLPAQMIGLDFLTSFIDSALVLFLSFWPGYLLLGQRLSSKRIPFVILVPVYLTLGLAILTIGADILGAVMILPSAIVAVSVIAMLLVLYPKLRDSIRARALERFRIRLTWRALSSVLVLLLLAATFVYFNIVAGIMRWPPPGDLIAHGQLTSLIMYRGFTPTNLLPIFNGLQYYPSGLHTLVANLSELFGLVPGEEWLNFGAITVFLIVAMAFSLTYSITRSTVLSIIPLLSVFYVNSKGDLTTYFLGYLYNGPYPNLYGYLISLLLLFFVATYDCKDIRCFLGLLLAESVLIMAYPNLSLTIGLVCAVPLMTSFRSRIWKEWGRAKIILVSLILILIGGVAVRNLTPVIQEWSSKLVTSGGIGSGYSVPPKSLQDPLTLIIMVSGICVAIWNCLKDRRLVYLSFLEILLGVSVFLSAVTYIPEESVIEPGRLLPLTWLLSMVLICVALAQFGGRENDTGAESIQMYKKELTRGAKGPRRTKVVATVLFFVLMFFSFESSLATAAAFTQTRYYSYYSLGQQFPSDFVTSEWICHNIKPGPLILNDQSWSGYFLTSYCFEDVVYEYFPHPLQYNNASLVWLDYQNETLVRSVLSSLDIKYIYVTADTFFLNAKDYQTSFTPAGYLWLNNPLIIQTFDTYPFLHNIYQYNESAVFEDNLTLP